jgi:Gpi18-like mannosyltransferase
MATADPSTRGAGRITRAAAPGRAGRPALSDRLPHPWVFPLLVFAATWLLILATWYGSDAVYGRSHPWTWHFLIKDASFYLGIAQHGYTGDPARAAFFPLLIHLTSYLTGGDYLAAGLIASVTCGAASAVAVWALAARACDRWVADRAVLLYCAFPGAMTFGILYSEPLAVALGAAALLALLDRRWLLAGIIGALATAARPSMIILVAASGVAALQAIRDRASGVP